MAAPIPNILEVRQAKGERLAHGNCPDAEKARREAVRLSIGSQQRMVRKAEGQRKVDEKLVKGLFETVAGESECFNEGARSNLVRVPDDSLSPGEHALPLSITRVQGTEE